MATKRLYFTIFETLNRTINWGFVFSLAFFLKPTEYGIIAVLISIEGMLAAVLLGGFDRAALRFISDPYLNVSEKTIFKLWLYLAIALVFILCLSIYVTDWTSRYYISNETLVIFICALIGVAVSRIVAAISRAKEHLAAFILVKLIAPVIKIGTLSVLLYINEPVSDSYFTAVAVGFLPLLFWPSLTYLAKDLSLAQRGVKKSVYFYALPFLPHSIAGIVLASIDRIMLNDILGVYEAGIYNFSYMIGSALSFVYAITAVTYERDLFSRSSDKLAVQNLQQIYFGLLNNLGYLAVIAVFILFFTLKKFDMEYVSKDSLIIAVVVMMSYIVNIHYLQSSYYLAVAKKTAFIAGITVMMMCINIFSNWILIPQFGAAGAAYATLFTYTLLSCLMTYTAIKKTDFNVFSKLQIIYSVISIVIIFAISVDINFVLIIAVLISLIMLKKTWIGAKAIWL